MKSKGPSHHFFKTWSGEELYYQAWIPEKKKGVLIVLHGLAEHGGRYGFFIDYFVKRGWAVYLMDQRGHGRSPGPRWHIDRFQDMVEDLESFVKEVRRREPKLPLFLIAHSFGGQVAVNYLARQPKEIKAAVLSGANLKLAMSISLVKRVFAYVLARFFPSFLLPNNINLSLISRDEAVVHAYKTDRLVGNKISLKFGTQILSNIEKIMDMAPKIKVPIMIFHGAADKITSPEGSKEFFERMTVKDKQLKLYPDFYHESFNEIGKEQVFADVEQWLESRLNK